MQKRNIKYLLLTFFLLLQISCSKKGADSRVSKVEEYKLSHVGEFNVNIPSNMALDIPVNIQISNDGTIFWGEKNRILTFVENGKKRVNIFESKGRGPGEILSASYYQVYNSDHFALLDNSQAKITVFDSSKSHLYDVPLSNMRTKKFVALNNSTFATFNTAVYKKDIPAISLHNKDGKLIHQWGKIPYYALLQSNRNGGGVTKDENGNIYYSFLGGYKIWKVNTETGDMTTFSQKPFYFDGVNREDIDKSHNNLKALIEYSFKVSRVTGLFFMQPNLILQQIDDGNPWEGEKVQKYLEIWNTEGKKLGQAELSHMIACIKDNNIYVFADTPSKLIKNASKDSTTKLFEIYRLEKKE